MVLTQDAEWRVRKEGTAERVPELGSRMVCSRTPNPMSRGMEAREGRAVAKSRAWRANRVIYCLNGIVSESEMEVLQMITQNNRWQPEL